MTACIFGPLQQDKTAMGGASAHCLALQGVLETEDRMNQEDTRRSPLPLLQEDRDPPLSPSGQISHPDKALHM